MKSASLGLLEGRSQRKILVWCFTTFPTFAVICLFLRTVCNHKLSSCVWFQLLRAPQHYRDCNDGHSVVSQFQLNGCILTRQTAVSTSTDRQSSVSLQSVPGALLLKGSQKDRCDATPESLSSYEMAVLLHAILTHYLSCTQCVAVCVSALYAYCYS